MYYGTFGRERERQNAQIIPQIAQTCKILFDGAPYKGRVKRGVGKRVKKSGMRWGGVGSLAFPGKRCACVVTDTLSEVFGVFGILTLPPIAV